MPNHDEDISDVTSFFEENAEVIGGDIIQKTVNSSYTREKMCRWHNHIK